MGRRAPLFPSGASHGRATTGVLVQTRLGKICRGRYGRLRSRDHAFVPKSPLGSWDQTGVAFTGGTTGRVCSLLHASRTGFGDRWLCSEVHTTVEVDRRHVASDAPANSWQAPRPSSQRCERTRVGRWTVAAKPRDQWRPSSLAPAQAGVRRRGPLDGRRFELWKWPRWRATYGRGSWLCFNRSCESEACDAE